MFRTLILAIATAALLPLTAQQETLTTQDIHRVMTKLLDYHVQVKEVTPEVVRRSYRVFLDHFDPQRTYLLQSEVARFTEASPAHLRGAVARYQKGDYSDFVELSEVVQLAILRAREWRPQLQEEVGGWIAEDKEVDVGPTESHLPYAKTLAELEQRQREHYYLIGRAQLRRDRDLPSTWKLYERRVGVVEDRYLFVDGDGNPMDAEEREHLLSVRTLKSFAKALDSHTAYFSPAEAHAMRMQLEKGFTGIGVVLEEGVDGIMVAKVIDGGPAADSGRVLVRDTIIEIDGEAVSSATFEEVLELLRGSEGSKLQLTLQRKVAEKKSEVVFVELTRERITLDDSRVETSYEWFGDGIIGTIKLDSFYEGNGVSSDQDIRDAIRSFRKVGDLRGLVLDFRDNLGGFLSQAIKVGGLFITNGVVAMSKYSDGSEVYFRELDGYAHYDGPLVVLTSKGSASAAEIVAQALQDYGKALVVGDARTYGKGSIQHQTITDKNADTFFKVTVGRYYTVSGRSTQITGVRADIVVPTALYDEQIGEEYLEFPLKGDRLEPAFNDTLKDLKPSVRKWFAKYYLPTLQKPTDRWTRHLVELRRNSQRRIASSENYQAFLKAMKRDQPFVDANDEGLFGVHDLQVEEAINIVKDMVILDERAKPKASALKPVGPRCKRRPAALAK